MVASIPHLEGQEKMAMDEAEAKRIAKSLSRAMLDELTYPTHNVMDAGKRINRTVDALRDRGLAWIDPHGPMNDPVYTVRLTEEGEDVTSAFYELPDWEERLHGRRS